MNCPSYANVLHGSSREILDLLFRSCALDQTQGTIGTWLLYRECISNQRSNRRLTFQRCHPSETAAGHNFTHMFPNEDNAFLGAFQQYAESVFSELLLAIIVHPHPDTYRPATPKHNILLASADTDNDSESEGIENDAVTEEEEDGEERNGEENGQGSGMMGLNDPSLYRFSQTPDASSYASGDASSYASEGDASSYASGNASSTSLNPSASLIDASLSLIDGFIAVDPASFYAQVRGI